MGSNWELHLGLIFFHTVSGRVAEPELEKEPALFGSSGAGAGSGPSLKNTGSFLNGEITVRNLKSK